MQEDNNIKEKNLFILTESEVVAILKTHPQNTWMEWRDNHAEVHLSFVTNNSVVAHLARDQEDQWVEVMKAGLAVKASSIIASLSNERLREQIPLSPPANKNTQAVQNNNHHKILSVLQFIKILHDRGLPDAEITKLIKPRPNETYEPGVKAKVFKVINTTELHQRITLCRDILSNDLHPFNCILRENEWWNPFWAGLNSNTRSSKIKVEEILNAALQQRDSAPAAKPERNSFTTTKPKAEKPIEFARNVPQEIQNDLRSMWKNFRSLQTDTNYLAMNPHQSHNSSSNQSMINSNHQPNSNQDDDDNQLLSTIEILRDLSQSISSHLQTLKALIIKVQTTQGIISNETISTFEVEIRMLEDHYQDCKRLYTSAFDILSVSNALGSFMN